MENQNIKSYHIKKRDRSESFGANYGSKIDGRDGIVTDLTTLPHGTFFYVHNGCWQGYIERQDNKCIIYAGANKTNPTGEYVNRIVVEPGYTYDALITILDGKERERHIVLTETQIACFLAYIKDNDMPIAFGNSDWLEVYNKIIGDAEEPEEIKKWRRKYNSNDEQSDILIQTTNYLISTIKGD